MYVHKDPTARAVRGERVRAAGQRCAWWRRPPWQRVVGAPRVKQFSKTVQWLTSMGIATGMNELVQKFWKMLRVDDPSQLPSEAWRQEFANEATILG